MTKEPRLATKARPPVVNEVAEDLDVRLCFLEARLPA
jgi:hypothetical protein